MTGLGDLEDLFQKHLLDGGDTLAQHLKDDGPFLGVYDNAYTARLMEVLAEDFTTLHTLLGAWCVGGRLHFERVPFAIP